MVIQRFYLTRKILFFVILVGIVSGFGAFFFFVLLHIFSQFFLGVAEYYPPGPAGEKPFIELPKIIHGHPLLIAIIPAIGGLISGIITYSIAPETEGHGTDAVIEAFHHKGGEIRARVPPVKTLTSAITIGSGGSAGREGPIAQIGAGFASYIASKFKLSDREREILVMSGTAAGIGSIFKAPVGASLFATEVLYKRDFEMEVFIPSLIATFIGYGVFSMIVGWQSIFDTPTYILIPAELPLYALLGLVTGLLAKLYVWFFYSTRDKFFKKIPIPNHFKPFIGGLLVGIIGLAIPEALATGYGWLQLALYGKLALEIMLILIFAKIVTTAFTISSGGSGGVFAPSLVIGGMIGGTMGIIFKILFPSIVIDPRVFVLIGMASFFAGAAKVPLASIVMVAEMTGEYSILAPAILASVVAYIVSGESTIYEQQLDRREESPVHIPEYFSMLLYTLKVKDAMSPDYITIYEDNAILEVEQIVGKRHHLAVPVVNRNNKCVGLVTIYDILNIPPVEWSNKKVKNVLKKTRCYVSPDEPIINAISLMLKLGIGRLPVVNNYRDKIVIGEITYEDIFKIVYYKAGEKLPEIS